MLYSGLCNTEKSALRGDNSDHKTECPLRRAFPKMRFKNVVFTCGRDYLQLWVSVMARRGLWVIKLKLRLLSVPRTDIFQQPTVAVL